MKTLNTLAFICLLALCGCKKDSSSTFGSLNIQVSGLTDKTSLSIVASKSTMNTPFYSITNQFGNKTYTTPATLVIGDKVNITVTANVNDNLAGDGDGNVIFYYKGKNIGGHGGMIGKLGFSQQITIQ
jgi:hypothetical protein